MEVQATVKFPSTDMFAMEIFAPSKFNPPEKVPDTIVISEADRLSDTLQL